MKLAGDAPYSELERRLAALERGEVVTGDAAGAPMVVVVRWEPETPEETATRAAQVTAAPYGAIIVEIAKYRPMPGDEVSRSAVATIAEDGAVPFLPGGGAAPLPSVPDLDAPAPTHEEPEGQSLDPAPFAPAVEAEPPPYVPEGECEPATEGVPFHICAWSPVDGFCTSGKGCQRRAPSFRAREREEIRQRAAEAARVVVVPTANPPAEVPEPVGIGLPGGVAIMPPFPGERF